MRVNTYEDHRSHAFAEYADEFRDWLAEKTPAELARLRTMGIGGALEDGASSGVGLEHDAAELPTASYQINSAREADTLADEIGEFFELDQQVALPLAGWMVKAIENRSVKFRSALLVKLCGAFIDGRNPRLLAAGLAFAADLAALNGLKTQRSYARKIRVTPAALSKVTKFWQTELNLAVSPHMKSTAACGVYSTVQKGVAHWRRQKASVKALLPLMSQGNGNGNGSAASRQFPAVRPESNEGAN